MRRVVWSSRANKSFREIVEYIAADNPYAADRVAVRIVEAVSHLGTMPAGRPGRVKGSYEKLVIGLPYFLVFRMNEQRIVVSDIVHTSRKWPPLGSSSP